MKTSLKTLLVAAAFGVSALIASAQTAPKIAIIDLAKVFDGHYRTQEQGEKLKFFELFGHQARISGVTTMLWDNGQHFDRTAGVWRDAELFRQISSSWRTRSGTAAAGRCGTGWRKTGLA